MGYQFPNQVEPPYRVGGYIPGSVEVELFEGERIIDRHGNIVGEVINGEFVQVAPPSTAQPRQENDPPVAKP